MIIVIKQSAVKYNLDSKKHNFVHDIQCRFDFLT